MKKKKKSRTLLVILLLILLPVISITGFKVVSILLDYKKDEDFNQDIRDLVIISETEIPVKSPEPANRTAAPHNTFMPGETAAPDEDKPLVIDFAKLKEINQNCFCWIQIPGTDVSYPVVYTDDNSYYLRRGLDGSKLSSGTLFADSRNRHFYRDDNFIIYGHHVQSGIMFAPLVKYKAQSFYDTHKYGYIICEDANYRMDFFAGLVTDSKDEVYTTTLQSENLFNEFVRKCEFQSTFSSNIAVKYGDRIITLSTCSYEFENARYVLVGKLTKITG